MRPAQMGDGPFAWKALVRVKVPDGGRDFAVLIVHDDVETADVATAVEAALAVALKDELKEFDSLAVTVERVR